MTDSADPAPADPRAYWKLRSEGWTATTIAPLPTDDTFNQAMIAALDIAPDERVIDLAGGTGDPSISIARALGADGSVTACDLTQPMLKAAQGRAAALALDNWRAITADMMALPFADDRFDVATCRFGLMFPEDRVACAREALRVLGPGGRSGWLVWGTMDENPSFMMVRDALSRWFGEDLSVRRTRHALGASGQVAEILSAAGFADVEERLIAYDRTIAPGGDYFTRAIRRAFPDRYDTLSPAEIASVIAAIEESCADLRDGDAFRVPHVARLGIGRKAA